MQPTYYCALYADTADQHEILAFDVDPDMALGIAEVVHGPAEMIVVQANRRLSELLETGTRPSNFRITPQGLCDVVTFEDLAYWPASPASAAEAKSRD